MLLSICTYSQQNFYYVNGNKAFWQDDSTSINVIVGNRDKYNDIAGSFARIFVDEHDTIYDSDEDDNIIIISDKLKKIKIDSLVCAVSSGDEDIVFITYAKRTATGRLWLRNEVNIKMTDTISLFKLLEESPVNNDILKVENDGHNEFTIYCRNEESTIVLANYLYNKDNIIFSTPDFYNSSSHTVNDEYYNEQWGLNNTGQNEGVAGVDINAPQAWDYINNYISNPSHNIKVAVIDDGVEPHVDFYYGGGVCKVLDGYTCGGGTGRPLDDGYHGECCAGIIGAVHNGIGVAGVAPYSKIVPVRIFKKNSRLFSNKKIAKAIRYAWEELGVDIMSNSWKLDNESDQITNAFTVAMTQGRNGKGCIVVVASGNDNMNQVQYPSRINGVISVGAVDRCGYRSGGYGVSQDHCEAWDNPYSGSSYGEKLSVVAPGTHIYTLDREGVKGLTLGDYNSNFSGTSAACPHVAGVAALILSASPNLSAYEVKTAIEKTAQRIHPEIYYYENSNTSNDPNFALKHPNGDWCLGLGYGLVDAYAAIKAVTGKPFDLYTRDNDLDNGSEPTPYSITPSPFDSPDIWVRRLQDDGLTHQRARQDQTNYVYVNVHNKGDMMSSGEDTLKIYFHMAGIGTNQWPNGWRLLGQANIPQIQSNGYSTLCIPGHFPALPNLPHYYFSNDADYMLLSKIVSDIDYLTYPESSVTGSNIINNNNISSKNVVVSNAIWIGDMVADMAIAAIDNLGDEPYFTNLICSSPQNESGKPLYEEAEIRMCFDAQLIHLWEENEGTADNMKRVDDTTFLITGPDAQLNNFVIPANYEGYMVMQINFLTQEYTEKDKYEYVIDEYNPTTGEFQGSLTVMVDKSMRSYLFDAETCDDLVVTKNSSVTVSSENIGENAIYNWYNAADSLIGSGENLSITASTTSKYKLEVIATADGYKDYDSVFVVTTLGKITGISPNPANGQVTISYDLSSDVTSASIVIASATGQVLYSAPLDVTQTTHTVNLQAIPTGQYTVRIESQGLPLDSKTLIVY